MNIPRTQQEILERVESQNKEFFEFILEDTLLYLTFENAKKFLDKGSKKEDWDNIEKKLIHPLDKAIDYVDFAWEKANNCRGLSASRSIEHFKAWLWLCGIDGFDDIADKEYKYYGKPVLVIVCTALGIDWKYHDDCIWTIKEDGEDEYPDQSEIDRLISIGETIKSKLDEINHERKKDC